MNDAQTQLKIDYHIKELEELGGFDTIFSEVHKTLYEKMINAQSVESHQEIYYIIKSLKEVESVIQRCTNRANEHTQGLN